MDKLNIAGIIIAKNEEKNIAGAIRSLDFCREVYVADDSSGDHTVEVALANVAKTLALPAGLNFAEKRNHAAHAVKGDWLLFLDADEKISGDLKREIIRISNKNSPGITAYQIKRRDFFWGKELKWGETRKARIQGIVRLVKRDKGQWEGAVHEVWKTDGITARLEHFIDHSPHPTLKEFIGKVNVYSTLYAKFLVAKGERPSIAKIIFYPAVKFLLTYLFYLGFLDGVEGFIYSFVMSFHSFLVRSKVYQYTNEKETSL